MGVAPLAHAVGRGVCVSRSAQVFAATSCARSRSYQFQSLSQEEFGLLIGPLGMRGVGCALLSCGRSRGSCTEGGGDDQHLSGNRRRGQRRSCARCAGRAATATRPWPMPVRPLLSSSAFSSCTATGSRRQHGARRRRMRNRNCSISPSPATSCAESHRPATSAGFPDR